MDSSPLKASRLTLLGGLWVAGIGFFITRFTVTLAAYEDPTRFLLAGVVPLILGLVLAAFGVALVVGSFEPRFVRTTAMWTTVGAVTMLALVLLTLIGSDPDGVQSIGTVRSKTYLANFLIGGSVGGTLTGVYASLNDRYRVRVEQQANRLVVLNRILRDEMLNAVAVIRGNAEQVRAGVQSDTADQSLRLIENRSDRIESTITEVKYLTETVDASATEFEALDLPGQLESAVDRARERFPDAVFEIHTEAVSGIQVWANSRLSLVLDNLLENAVEHNDSATPRITIVGEASDTHACFKIIDNGPGLPDQERATLERGDIEDHEDPSSGFGLNLVRLLVEQYNGAVETTVSEEGTTVEVVLGRAGGNAPPISNPVDVRSYGVDLEQIVVAIAASLLAGGVMGIVIQTVAGVVPVIGALYGAMDPLVGWITHEFHSVVFGLIYAGIVAIVPARYGDRALGRVGIGILWALSLSLIAAGFVMPVWLRLVGLPAPLPSFNPASVAGHIIWGIVLGGSYHVGLRWLDSRPVE